MNLTDIVGAAVNKNLYFGTDTRELVVKPVFLINILA